MPMHDWTRTDLNGYHDFRFGWLVRIADALNGGVLPSDHYALSERTDPRILRLIPTPRLRRISVYRAADHRAVAAVEIVSPAFTAKQAVAKEYNRERNELLQNGIHLLVVNPFPHDSRMAGECPDRPLMAAAYAAGDPIRAFVEPLAVGDRLPTMPLFLTPDGYVNLPLEPAYAAAWKVYPAPVKARVEGR